MIALAACGSEAPQKIAPIAAVVRLSPGQVAIEGVVPATQLIPRGHMERKIRFELRDSEGAVLSYGVVSDPRLKRFEALRPDGTIRVELVDTGVGELTIRLPQSPGELIFFEESADELSTVEIGRTAFDPSRLQAGERGLRRSLREPQQDSYCSISEDGTSCATLIAGSGSQVLNVDFVFVAAGFADDEMDDFRTVARSISADIVNSEDLGRYASRLNFWALDEPGSTDQINDPRFGDDDDGDLKRKLEDNAGYPEWNDGFRNRIKDRVEYLGAEAVVVIARSRRCSEGCEYTTTNDDGDEVTEGRCLGSSDLPKGDERAGQICYNWGGVANSGQGFTVGNEGDPNIADMLIHEVGHAYFELGDEYGVNASTGCSDKNAMNKARDFKNLTLNANAVNGIGGTFIEVVGGLSGAKDVYWEDMITIDTPDADFDAYTDYGYDFSALEDEVGEFVGGGTCRRKIMRGQLQCRMFTHWEQTWCDVCQKLVKEKFDNWQEDAGDDGVCPRRWDGDGICDPCLGDDSDCCSLSEGFAECAIQRYTCGDTVCSALYGEDADSCPGDCAPKVCGNGICEGQEGAYNTSNYCGEDCGCGAVDTDTDVAPIGCFCGPDCAEYGDCCADACDAFGNGC